MARGPMTAAFLFAIAIAFVALPDFAHGQDCEAVLNGLASSPACAQLQSNTQIQAPKAAVGDCQTVQALQKTYASIPTECCPALRLLVTKGCACDKTFAATVAAFGGYDAKSVVPVMQGTLKLIQEGICANAENGGRLVNPCDGSVGPCASSRRLTM
eukprot:jgi/Botrbrau1/4280/Bobra.0390s0020.1